MIALLAVTLGRFRHTAPNRQSRERWMAFADESTITGGPFSTSIG
jgi:hypothetical protein